MRLLRRTIFSMLAAVALSGPALADPALWKVSDADSAVYLFGSVHMFTRDVDWRTPEFDAILKAAEHVYFEVVMDIEAYSTITQISITKGMLRDGKTLADLLTPDEHRRLSGVAAQSGLDVATLERMQPWFATMALMGGGSGIRTRAGVEMLLDAEIAPERKRSLETAAEQMGFLADAPIEEQIDALMSTVEGIESGATEALEPLMAAWERGDTSALLRAMTEQMTPRDRASYDTLVTKRNERWLTPIEQMLADNDDSLIIVGAGHLVGSGGVPALLEQRSYTVERVDEPPAGGPPAARSDSFRRRSAGSTCRRPWTRRRRP
ncbi:MAG: hypothetical protein JWQ89_2075 [Devosia sp.]|uniref:TraB/GumN family protein n=1 Tax=Devosia sp. TaxID=1871048 RepID=UPI00261C7CF1|nr:TraB/GumN family protein [Devosia sp.]MDB5540348.1 hypothetical protein [Devosia sp.]